MTKQGIALGLAVVAVLIAIAALVVVLQVPKATEEQAPLVGAAGPTSSTQGDWTVRGGTINAVTTDAATSTVIAGCIQMTATTTGTPYKLVIGASKFSTSTFGAGTGTYLVVAVPGTCPNL